MTQQAGGPLRVIIEGFYGGAGAGKGRPGFYQVGRNFDGRYGGPGPREVIDLTGIAAGYRVVKMVRHADTPMLATTNGTDTIIYQIPLTGASAGVWYAVATITSRVATDLISFKNVIAVAFGASFAYQYVANVTTNSTAYVFAASTKTTVNAKFANYFLVQGSRDLPRVAYVVAPNELYFTESLTDSDATGSTTTYIGDYSSTLNFPTSLSEADGKLLIGMRRALYSIDSDDVVKKETRDYADPRADAGGNSDRKNFENPQTVGGRIYFPIEGYDLLEYYRGTKNEDMAPRRMNLGLPRMDLPINAMCVAGNWLIVALGTTNATLKSVTYAPGGNAHLANQFTTISEIWMGQYETGESGEVFVWHGNILECTNPLQYMWFDEDTSYLYLCSGETEIAANIQQTRCLFYTDNPRDRLTSGSIILNNGTWQVDYGYINGDSPFDYYRAKSIAFDTIGLSGTEGTNPSIAVSYKLTPDYDTTAFETKIPTFYDNGLAELGQEFEPAEDFRSIYLRFIGVGTGNTYSFLRRVEFEAVPAPSQRRTRGTR